MTVEELKARLREDLKAAMRSRDLGEVSLLRALAAAVDNAEAVPLAVREESDALRIEGAGPSEAQRRELTADDIADLLDRECTERLDAAVRYEALRKDVEAARLREEVELVARYRQAC